MIHDNRISTEVDFYSHPQTSDNPWQSTNNILVEKEELNDFLVHCCPSSNYYCEWLANSVEKILSPFFLPYDDHIKQLGISGSTKTHKSISFSTEDFVVS